MCCRVFVVVVMALEDPGWEKTGLVFYPLGRRGCFVVFGAYGGVGGSGTGKDLLSSTRLVNRNLLTDLSSGLTELSGISWFRCFHCFDHRACHLGASGGSTCSYAEIKCGGSAMIRSEEMVRNGIDTERSQHILDDMTKWHCSDLEQKFCTTFLTRAVLRSPCLKSQSGVEPCPSRTQPLRTRQISHRHAPLPTHTGQTRRRGRRRR